MMRPHSSIEKVTHWIGSVSSVIVHTIAFAIAFLCGLFHIFTWENILLIVTTLVSLEAIYLAIFIQMTVNQNTKTLKAVEVDVDEIQKDIDGIEQDVDEIQEEDEEEAAHHAQHRETLASISIRLQKLLEDIETMKTKPE